MASCYLAVHSGKVKISIEELAKDSSAYISWIGGTDWVTESQANASNRDFSKYRRVWFKFTAPNTGHIRFAIQMNSINGGVNPWAFVLRPMLEECTQYATQPSPWQNAGVTSIHGGSIVTHSITAEQIAADTITGNEIVGGTIAGKHIASKTINAGHIASKSITAEELSVESLSAISADLGAITGGSLKIGSLNGNLGTLFEVHSNGGFRLISRDASGGIELSSATRALHVWDGGAEVVRVGKLS